MFLFDMLEELTLSFPLVYSVEMVENTKSLSLNKLLPSNPPLKKGDIGGFALARFGKIPQPPLTKGGLIIKGQALRSP
jgi:hypothetical protein